MIVMIGHYSGMTLATGVDHIVYGALFFAVIIFIMFYIGSFWRDPEIKQENIVTKNIVPNSYTTKQTSVVFGLLLVSLVIWPLSHYQLLSHYKAQTTVPDWSTSALNAQWVEIKPPHWEWQPKFNGAANESTRYYRKNDSIIGIYQANFGDEKQGSELINTQHVLVHREERDKWHTIKQSTLNIASSENNKSITVDIERIRAKSTDYSAAKWYQVGDLSTNNPYLAKVKQLYKKLTLDNSLEIYYVVFTSQSAFEEAYSDKIEEFISTVIIR